ncbi:MAG: DUF3990 domain-containing protein [Spirochaetaceae bacterium]|nr:DUF3990 domain-containing protein [Spirochaetaceae bacterium]
MTVYHGSTTEIKKPDVSFSKKYLDFGIGVYVTAFKNQAEKWALRKADRVEKGIATVNVFDIAEELNDYKVLDFKTENEEWLDFVCDCRKGSEIYKNYDIIIGAVADDDVFKTVNMYFRGFWDKKKTLDEIRYYKTNNQICITKQEVVDKILTFKYSYTVEAK